MKIVLFRRFPRLADIFLAHNGLPPNLKCWMEKYAWSRKPLIIKFVNSVNLRRALYEICDNQMGRFDVCMLHLLAFGVQDTGQVCITFQLSYPGKEDPHMEDIHVNVWGK